MRVTYSGLIAYWIDGQGCSWLGPVECSPWRYGTPTDRRIHGFVAKVIGTECAEVPLAQARDKIAKVVTAFRFAESRQVPVNGGQPWYRRTSGQSRSGDRRGQS